MSNENKQDKEREHASNIGMHTSCKSTRQSMKVKIEPQTRNTEPSQQGSLVEEKSERLLGDGAKPNHGHLCTTLCIAEVSCITSLQPSGQPTQQPATSQPSKIFRPRFRLPASPNSPASRRLRPWPASRTSAASNSLLPLGRVWRTGRRSLPCPRSLCISPSDGWPKPPAPRPKLRLDPW